MYTSSDYDRPYESTSESSSNSTCRASHRSNYMSQLNDVFAPIRRATAFDCANVEYNDRVFAALNQYYGRRGWENQFPRQCCHAESNNSHDAPASSSGNSSNGNGNCRIWGAFLCGLSVGLLGGVVGMALRLPPKSRCPTAMVRVRRICTLGHQRQMFPLKIIIP